MMRHTVFVNERLLSSFSGVFILPSKFLELSAKMIDILLPVITYKVLYIRYSVP